LPVEARLPWLPIDTRHGGFIEHEERRHAGSNRHGEIGCRDLFQIELNHHVLGDLSALGCAILQALEPVLHLSDANLEPACQSFIGQCRPDDGRDDLVQVGEALNRVGEGLFINAGVLRTDPIADCAIVDSGEFEIHYGTPVWL